MRIRGHNLFVLLAAGVLLVVTGAMAEGTRYDSSTLSTYGTVHPASSRAVGQCPSCGDVVYGDGAAPGEAAISGRTWYGDRSASRSADLCDQVRSQNREIRSQLSRIQRARPHERAMYWAQLRQVLVPHMCAQERVVFPVAAENERTYNDALRAQERHAVAASLFQKLDAANPNDPRWHARFIVFKDVLDDALRSNEDQLLVACRRGLSSAEYSGLSASYLNQRQIVGSSPSFSECPLLSGPSSSLAPASLPSPAASSALDKSTHSSMDMSSQSSLYDMQPTGFDTLQSQNMSLCCPDCGMALGTFTPASPGVVSYEETTMNGVPTGATEAVPTNGTTPAPMDTTPVNGAATPAPANGTAPVTPAPANGTAPLGANGATGLAPNGTTATPAAPPATDLTDPAVETPTASPEAMPSAEIHCPGCGCVVGPVASPPGAMNPMGPSAPMTPSETETAAPTNSTY